MMSNLENLKKISFEEHKKIQLDILKDVSSFCDSHGLRYWLAYGTLIGAIRQKGFIPWDDDIDIQMPRCDYNRFIEMYNIENGSDYRYFAVDPKSEYARHSMLKIIDKRTIKVEEGISCDPKFYLGVDIDVFPLDGEPDNVEEFKDWYSRLNNVYRTYARCMVDYSFGSLKRRVLGPLYVFFFGNKKRLMNKSKMLHDLYPLSSCRFAGAIETPYNLMNNRSRKECYEECVDVEFEKMMFKAPAGYDEILRDLFGDYMQLPPVEERKTHHFNHVYWKNK